MIRYDIYSQLTLAKKGNDFAKLSLHSHAKFRGVKYPILPFNHNTIS